MRECIGRGLAGAGRRGYFFLCGEQACSTPAPSPSHILQAVGLDKDMKDMGLGTRSCRYSMLVEDQVVKAVNPEEGDPCTVSSAENMLKTLS